MSTVATLHGADRIRMSYGEFLERSVGATPSEEAFLERMEVSHDARRNTIEFRNVPEVRRVLGLPE